MKTEYTKVVDIRQEAVYSSHSIAKEQRDFVMEFKKYRGVCTGNNTGSSAGTYVGTECIGF